MTHTFTCSLKCDLLAAQGMHFCLGCFGQADSLLCRDYNTWRIFSGILQHLHSEELRVCPHGTEMLLTIHLYLWVKNLQRFSRKISNTKSCRFNAAYFSVDSAAKYISLCIFCGILLPHWSQCGKFATNPWCFCNMNWYPVNLKFAPWVNFFPQCVGEIC